MGSVEHLATHLLEVGSATVEPIQLTDCIHLRVPFYAYLSVGHFITHSFDTGYE